MKKLTNSEVIEKINTYCDYDTSLVDYKNSATKLCLICHQEENGVEHGIFCTTIGHLKQGHGCPKCGTKKRISKRVMSLENFIERARNVHGDKYDYSKVEYKQAHTKICIICPKHGEFWQTPASHLQGKKCPKCSKPHSKYTKDAFIKKAKEVHGDKYDYSKVEYINSQTKVCIICPKHGEFWQKPNDHLCGKGCPKCNESHLEKSVEGMLIKEKVKYIYQYKTQWLGKQSLDFYLPDYNIGIECQGTQHFGVGKWAENDNIIERDKKKFSLCNDNQVDLIYLIDKKNKSYVKEDIIDRNKIFIDLNDIILYINEKKKG